jgi:tetratricopeptide (TPR) repeat protein
LISDCLAKEPARRPATAAEVRDRLAVARDERTPPSLGHSVSMIREGKQPVVLLWAELPRVDRALLASLTGRRLVIASQRGRKVLAGVLGGEHADPASIAIAAARELAAAGARVALHLEALRVTTSAGASTLHGVAVDKPETWLPTGTWTGVLVSDALASVTQAATRDSEAAGFRALGEAQETIELVGREGLVTDLLADAAVALGGVPTFALLVGDPGVGKTAVASELAKRGGKLFEPIGVRVHLGSVPAPGGGKPGHSALAGLIGTPQGPLVRAIGDALRAAARAQPTAVILDDLHFAEHELLDALEYATLGGEPLALWVLGVSSPRLEARRPQLGARAERRRRDVLPALDEDAAVALTAALLRPAEYPPLRALRRLAAIAHGNPLHLMMLAREMHQRGAVRERAGGTHFLDTSALDELSPAALGPWLAARELADLSSELVALARLCAVLGGEVTRRELGAIVEAVERSGGATTTIDADIGLRELVAAGLLIETERGYSFRQALVEEGVYTTTNEDERGALHRAALAFWRRASLDDAEAADRVARHATAIDDRAVAATAYAALGRAAQREHRALEADQAWSNAIRNLPQPDAERARALIGRASARYRLQRVRDALADLDEASSIARGLRDVELELEAWIERGTVLDWADDWEGSAQAAVEARRLYELAPTSGLAVDVELGEARALFRAQKFAEAEPRLAAVRERAREHDRHDAEIIASLLHATVLVDLGRYDEAIVVFDVLIPMCLARDDRFHLGVAYANRSWLWSSQGEIERCNEDLRRVIQLARESGHVSVERIATYNLGEALLWQGSYDEALGLARRSASLQLVHGEGAANLDQLLIARILAARDDRAELATVLGSLTSASLSPSEQATMHVLRCAADAAPAAEWLRTLAAADEQLTVENHLELHRLAARHGVLPEAALTELRRVQATHPLWSKLPGV